MTQNHDDNDHLLFLAQIITIAHQHYSRRRLSIVKDNNIYCNCFCTINPLSTMTIIMSNVTTKITGRSRLKYLNMEPIYNHKLIIKFKL